ncbi:FUSC family protein [Streptomyces echinatus]|uniref:FUSC family protein n=1 Tax=Streptomyces echinatus TaxID=67293 RepID=UPI0037FFE23E
MVAGLANGVAIGVLLLAGVAAGDAAAGAWAAMGAYLAAFTNKGGARRPRTCGLLVAAVVDGAVFAAGAATAAWFPVTLVLLAVLVFLAAAGSRTHPVLERLGTMPATALLVAAGSAATGATMSGASVLVLLGGLWYAAATAVLTPPARMRDVLGPLAQPYRLIGRSLGSLAACPSAVFPADTARPHPAAALRRAEGAARELRGPRGSERLADLADPLVGRAAALADLTVALAATGPPPAAVRMPCTAVIRGAEQQLQRLVDTLTRRPSTGADNDPDTAQTAQSTRAALAALEAACDRMRAQVAAGALPYADSARAGRQRHLLTRITTAITAAQQDARALLALATTRLPPPPTAPPTVEAAPPTTRATALPVTPAAPPTAEASAPSTVPPAAAAGVPPTTEAAPPSAPAAPPSTQAPAHTATPASVPAAASAFRRSARLRGLRWMRGVPALPASTSRHALRTTTVAGVVFLLTQAAALSHGEWATLAVLRVLRPQYAVTRERVAQRVIGNVVGGGCAAVLIAVVHEPAALCLILFVLISAGFTLRPVNYAFWVVFGTPLVLLIGDVSHPGDWLDAAVRIAMTLLGTSAALLGSRLLWPSWEHPRLAAHTAHAATATAAYLDTVLGSLGRPTRRPDAATTRGAAEKALAQAHTTCQNAHREPGHDPAALDDAARLLWTLDRLVVLTAALTTHVTPRTAHIPALASYTGHATAALSGRHAGQTARHLDALTDDLDEMSLYLDDLHTRRHRELAAGCTGETRSRAAIREDGPVIELLAAIAAVLGEIRTPPRPAPGSPTAPPP